MFQPPALPCLGRIDACYLAWILPFMETALTGNPERKAAIEPHTRGSRVTAVSENVVG